MPSTRTASTYLVILAAAAVAAVTMTALLVQFLGPSEQSLALRSVIVALAGAGAALALVAILNLTLVAARRAPAGHAEDLDTWARVWGEVSDGAPPPVVPRGAAAIASEAAALVLKNMVGEGAEAVRDAVAASGVLRAELTAVGQAGGKDPAALERLAWLAFPETLPLFLRAATGVDARAAHAGLFGACRVLAGRGPVDRAVPQVARAIADHTSVSSNPRGARPFIAAALVASGVRVTALCTQLLSMRVQEEVAAAVFDALGSVQPPDAATLVGDALIAGLTGEAEAAALRALGRIGSVIDAAVPAVVNAASSEHEGVRVQAAHTLAGVKLTDSLPVLWRLLGDRSYEVRLAAAAAMQRCGREGDAALHLAQSTHEDAFARDMAAMTASLPRGTSAALLRKTDWSVAAASARA